MVDILDDSIARMPIARLRKAYADHLISWADTDTHVRDIAAQVLTDKQINGDGCGVPTIEKIVESLVEKITNLGN